MHRTTHECWYHYHVQVQSHDFTLVRYFCIHDHRYYEDVFRTSELDGLWIRPAVAVPVTTLETTPAKVPVMVANTDEGLC